MNPRWLAAGALLALATMSLASTARADDDAARAAAQEHIAKGSQLFERHAYQDALAEFRAAYDAFPSPKIWFNIARSELALHNEPAAATAFEDFLDGTLEASDIAPARKFSREKLAELSSRLGRIEVEAVPAEAHLFVDDKPLNGTHAWLVPGPHQISARAPGFQDASQHINLRTAENRRLSLHLEAVRAPPVVLAPPPPEVAAAAPPAPESSKAAPVEAVTAQPQETHSATPGWALVGAGGALVVTSAVFGAMAASRNSSLAALSTGQPTSASPADAPSLRSQVKTDAWVSTAALGAGLVSAAVGSYLLLRF